MAKSIISSPGIDTVAGHAFSFIKDAQTLISHGKKYFQNSDEPFTITVAGQKLYILLSPDDVSAIYRNNTTLSWDAMLNDLLVCFGVRSSVIHKLWAQPATNPNEGKTALDPTQGSSAIHSTLEFYKKQLLPGQKFDVMSGTLLGNLNGSLSKKYVKARYCSSRVSMSLKDFTGEILVDAITRTLFGDRVYECEPNLVRHLLDFNDDAWMLVFKYPQSAASKLNVARDNILKGSVAYVQSPAEVHSGQAWLIESVLKRQKNLGIGDQDRAAVLLMIYWAANINPYKLAFWMLSYILFDPQLHLALREETSRAYQNGAIDVPHLLEQCPRVDATYQEALRVANGALSARKIVAPTQLGSKVLGSGNTILIPFSIPATALQQRRIWQRSRPF